MAIAGRGLHQRRFRDACRIHVGDQFLVGHRALARPVGLMTADRHARITRFVRRDHMWMDVDDTQCNSFSGYLADDFYHQKKFVVTLKTVLRWLG